MLGQRLCPWPPEREPPLLGSLFVLGCWWPPPTLQDWRPTGLLVAPSTWWPGPLEPVRRKGSELRFSRAPELRRYEPGDHFRGSSFLVVASTTKGLGLWWSCLNWVATPLIETSDVRYGPRESSLFSLTGGHTNALDRGRQGTANLARQNS